MTAVHDGQQALAEIRRSKPDLLITDVNMPGLTGLDLLQAARAEGLLRCPAIVLTSRCDQAEIAARAGRLGAVVHPKPFSPMRLAEAVASALKAERPGAASSGGTSPGSVGDSRALPSAETLADPIAATGIRD